METLKTSARFFYIDVLRAVAIIAVIFLHNSADAASQYGKIPIGDWAASAVYNGLVRFCVPMFILLSGSLLLNPGKETSIKELFNKRLPKLLIPLVVWSIIYAWFQTYTKNAFTGFGLKDYLQAFYRGPLMFHFWFLYVMIGIYLIYPIINLFIKSAAEIHIQYFLIVWFVVSCILPLMQILFNLTIGLELFSFTGYVGYFVLGYYLRNFEFSRRTLYLLYALSLLAFALSIAGIILLQIYHISYATELIESDFTLEIPLAVAGLFLFLKNRTFGDKSAWWKTIISQISLESYGIYIVHVLVMRLLFDKIFLGISFGSLGMIWVVPLKVIMIIIPSYLLVKLLKMVPWVRASV